ncbi:NADH-quinone oxidoreductase subunit NuoF [Anaerosacchariphilus polymeriproducens]|uniref:NADH-quinone oxidoreductase subunit NuoF n=1 Tax=Anaerosacchariphilus polymeriproducens TaxID=1812858 RepID=A0A371ARG3_9FIRM|nr:NADH-quinone oxidoreductase subunit NuoF [Anaerosacchariphilus polymeriproducens]RDU22159.1 NADH-quinone oxidoreductase subunit NuoF [Anaerosacchariphilus polymeriproducens]
MNNRINTREDLTRARAEYQKSLALQHKKILICGGTGCVAGGSLDIYDRMKVLMEEKGIKVDVILQQETHEESVGIKKSGCHGFCEMGPLLRIEPSGLLYLKVKVDDCEEIIEKSILNDDVVERLVYHDKENKVFEKQDEIPFYKQQTRVALERCGQINAESIREYIAIGGYAAVEKALFEMTQEEIIDEVTKASLRGRGGGGFPTGRKWSQVQRQDSEVKYVVCNGDEGDPGAFMDRSMMEGDPHCVIEGMMIAGIATGANYGYIYVRAEYPLAVERLETAIEQAKRYGLLGENILGSDFSFDLQISQGAGAFVCGEGSALTASIEGHRGMPRVKPPRTVEKGLFEKPTVLNNVETYCNVPPIIVRGSEWYKTYGPENNHGTKAFALTGNVQNTGLIEVPMGTTLKEVIFDVGGGVKDGEFKAVQIGGPSGGCLCVTPTEDHLELPLDFDSLKKVGAMIGSGGLVVMNDKNCMVEVARFFMNFTQNESCGKCVPCREGTKRMLELLTDIVEGRGTLEHLQILEDLGNTISETALCGLGKTAASPVLSTLKYFRDEYIAHVVDKKCPAGQCTAMLSYEIQSDLCKGCSLCAKKCPVEAISGEIKSPFKIDQTKCIKCGACMESCKFSAIKLV